MTSRIMGEVSAPSHNNWCRRRKSNSHRTTYTRSRKSHSCR